MTWSARFVSARWSNPGEGRLGSPRTPLCWRLPPGRERLLIGILLLALTAALNPGSSLGPSPVQAATVWQDIAGAQNRNEGIQALAFLPNEFFIDVGDSVNWTFPAGEPHTVSLGNLTGVTFTTPQECNGAASTTNQCTWDGTSAVTSGTKQEGATYTVTFTTTGDVPFVCLLHPNMTGTLHIRPAGTPYPHDQAFYDLQGRSQTNELFRLGRQVLEEDRQLVRQSADRDVIVGGTEPVVTTSGGLQSVFTPRFTRAEMTVPVGAQVTFVAHDTLAPHTVTFGHEPSNPFPPVNLAGPGEQTTLSTPYPDLMVGPTVSSGVLGFGAAGNGMTFKVTFAAAGNYQYYCAIHDELGMVGTIHVVANPHAGDDRR